MTTKYDALIIGGGHNGLVCAFYLARAGLKVRVLERRHIVGGAAVTEEFHPGFRNSTASYTVSLLRPKVIKDMRLHERGWRIIERTISNFFPHEGGYLKLGGGLARTQAEFARYSQKDAETLRARVETCEQANQYFKSMPNAAVRETVIKTSADIPAPLRKVLDDTPIGHLTPPEVTKQGIQMVALCGRKPTTIDTPKRKEMRDKMFAKKYEDTSNAYLAEIRKAAMIEYRQAGAEDSNAEDGSGRKKGRRN